MVSRTVGQDYSGVMTEFEEYLESEAVQVAAEWLRKSVVQQVVGK